VTLGKTCPRLVIAGTSSGVGKTTVTVALARAFATRGLRVATFKCGPDYLDPTYHARAVGRPSQNLDGWMMGRDAVLRTFEHEARDADLALIEGVMGLFDGASATSEEGSTAQLAKWLNAPVVLTVDAGGMARSFAAVLHGFASFDPALRVAAAIANRVGSRGHLELLREALPKELPLGGLPRDPDHAFRERHLGLHTADEQVLPTSVVDHWGELATTWLPLDELLSLARSAREVERSTSTERGAPPRIRARCRIGVAHDEAFHFYYADNLRRLEDAGAELVCFSPLRDGSLPDVDGLVLGGGYPEAHAAELSRNQAMRTAIARFAARGAPLYAECGGLMYLTRAIRTLDGQRHEMVGVFPYEAQMFERLKALGYVEVETRSATCLGPAGLRFRGHQFRYSELVHPPSPVPDVERTYSVRRRRGGDTSAEGYGLHNVLGSYVHAHWASNPCIADSFVRACANMRSGASTRPPTEIDFAEGG
jgi:cobyrinic acid a,c-diamide synthase